MAQLARSHLRFIKCSLACLQFVRCLLNGIGMQAMVDAGYTCYLYNYVSLLSHAAVTKTPSAHAFPGIVSKTDHVHMIKTSHANPIAPVTPQMQCPLPPYAATISSRKQPYCSRLKYCAGTFGTLGLLLLLFACVILAASRLPLVLASLLNPDRKPALNPAGLTVCCP